MHSFSYRMKEGYDLFPENKVVLIDTYGKNCGYSDFVKWRVRNILGKIIDDAKHPNGFELEIGLFQAYDGKIIVPASKEDIFYLVGSRKFKKEYLNKVPQEFRKQRVIKLL